MLNGVFVKTYPPTPFDRAEIMRYAGCKDGFEDVAALLEDTLRECANVFSYRVCYRVFETEDFFNRFQVQSKALQKNLDGCDYVVAFAATVGLEIDRFIAKYANVSMTKAWLLLAIGAERIESLCEAFCTDIKAQAKEKEYHPRPRFSAGYGDFPLETQGRFFAELDCARKIGLSLTDSFLMTPTKSVTAVVGLSKIDKEEKAGCAVCEKTDCAMRRK